MLAGASPDRARRDADDALEGAAERGLGSVPEPVGELAHRGALLLQRGYRYMHAPARDVAHHRLADELGEAGGERRARHRQLVGQRGDGPVPSGVAMNMCDGAADLAILERSQPAPLRSRIALD